MLPQPGIMQPGSIFLNTCLQNTWRLLSTPVIGIPVFSTCSDGLPISVSVK